jgi:hypothetical protein
VVVAFPTPKLGLFPDSRSLAHNARLLLELPEESLDF